MIKKKYILLFTSLVALLILLSSCGASMEDAEASDDLENKNQEKTTEESKAERSLHKDTMQNEFDSPKIIKHMEKPASFVPEKEPSTEKNDLEKESTVQKSLAKEKTKAVASTTATADEEPAKDKDSKEKSAKSSSKAPSSTSKSSDTNKSETSSDNSKDDKNKTIEPKKEQEKKMVLDIPYVNQYSPTYAPFGCEGASLLMALKYKTGTAVGLKKFLVDMPKDPKNPYNGFVSSPFKVVKGVFQSIFPGPLTAYGKNIVAE